MAYTEFYVQTTADNLNAGSTTADGAVYTGVGDSDGTSVFTPSDGSTPASTVNAGDFGSVYVTIGATVAVFVGRVTVVAPGVNGAITFSTTAKSGTFPAASAGAHTITCKTGGAWKGPNGAVQFPINFVAAAMTDVAADVPRVNFKTGVTYSITAAMSHIPAGPCRFQGYTASPGDGGKAIIDGGTSGTSYVLYSTSGLNVDFEDFIFQNNGATGSASGVALGNHEFFFRGVVVHDVRGNGIAISGTGVLVEAEIYNANQSAAGTGGLNQTGGSARRVTIHDNTGTGITISGGAIHKCIIDTNTGVGIQVNNVGVQEITDTDVYNSGSDGIKLSGSNSAVFIENCNLVKNNGWGINGAGVGHNGTVTNCGFGSGTQANASGATTALSGMLETGSVTYASGVTPWVDPANGDFRISLAAAKGAGRGVYTETAASYSGTVGFPDIGAAQHLDTDGGGGSALMFLAVRQS
jgi:hypothetical protein